MTSHAVSSVAGGGPELVGRFTYDVFSGTWWWSDEMFQIYAFAPRSVAPTTELILSHVHPDDLVRTQHLLDAAVSHGRPFSSHHRIVDARRVTGRSCSPVIPRRGTTAPPCCRGTSST